VAGAILATEQFVTASNERECLMVQTTTPTAPTMSADRLEAYARWLLSADTRDGLNPHCVEKHLLSAGFGVQSPVGKVVVTRRAEIDRRTEVHYVLVHLGRRWQVTYLLRPSSLDAWQSRFAEMETLM
jgi:hypothetical protein